jgi:ABC-2 type transport system permease protein
LSIHDLGQVPRLTAAAAAQIPALWVLAAVAALLIGWLPRAVNAVWGVLAVLIVIGVFGDMLRLPQLLRDVSPFAPTSHVPSAAMPYGAAIVLCVVAVVGLAAGAVGLARRDIG